MDGVRLSTLWHNIKWADHYEYIEYITEKF
jgi:hypothetical protein